MNEDNRQVHWGTVTAVSVSEIPPQTTGKYLGLFQDVSLRLENTPPTEALRVPIDDPKTLAGAHAALRKMFKGQKVEVLKRAGALFIYNTVAPQRRGRPSKSLSIAEMGAGARANGRRDPFKLLDGPDDAGYGEEVT